MKDYARILGQALAAMGVEVSGPMSLPDEALKPNLSVIDGGEND